MKCQCATERTPIAAKESLISNFRHKFVERQSGHFSVGIDVLLQAGVMYKAIVAAAFNQLFERQRLDPRMLLDVRLQAVEVQESVLAASRLQFHDSGIWKVASETFYGKSVLYIRSEASLKVLFLFPFHTPSNEKRSDALIDLQVLLNVRMCLCDGLSSSHQKIQPHVRDDRKDLFWISLDKIAHLIIDHQIAGVCLVSLLVDLFQ